MSSHIWNGGFLRSTSEVPNLYFWRLGWRQPIAEWRHVSPSSRGSFAFEESDKLAPLSRCHRKISRLDSGLAHRQKSDVRPKLSCSSSTILDSCANNFQGVSIFDRSELQIPCQRFRPRMFGVHGSMLPLVTSMSNISHCNNKGRGHKLEHAYCRGLLFK